MYKKFHSLSSLIVIFDHALFCFPLLPWPLFLPTCLFFIFTLVTISTSRRFVIFFLLCGFPRLPFHHFSHLTFPPFLCVFSGVANTRSLPETPLPYLTPNRPLPAVWLEAALTRERSQYCILNDLSGPGHGGNLEVVEQSEGIRGTKSLPLALCRTLLM